MSETYLNAESDSIVDSKSFSGLSLIALVLSVVGAFSLFYSQLLPIAILAVVLGLIVLWMAPKHQFNNLSKGLALVSIAIATVFGTWGTAHRQMQTAKDLVQAKKVAEALLSAIQNQEREKALLLMGVPEINVNAPPGDDPMARVEEVKRNYSSSPAFHEIRRRATPPKWEFVRVDHEFGYGAEHYYRLRYRDVAQTVPAEYSVTVHKNTSKDGPIALARKKGKKILEPSDQEVSWYADSIESTVKVTD